MFSIYKKDLTDFFSSWIAYIAIGVFVMFLGLYMWVFEDTSVLSYNYANLDQLFSIAPLIFLFLIPAISMRSFSEELQNGTLELLLTKPISIVQIVLAKYLANVSLVLVAIIPTFIYYYSVYKLGLPEGNLDSGSIMGSYIGLFLLACCFVSIGMFASSLTKNQIVAFALGAFLCFFFYWAFYFISRMPMFIGQMDDLIQKFGISHYYESISRGVIDTRDLMYFFSLIIFFLSLTTISIQKRKW